MSKPRPAPGVSYAGGLPEFLAASRGEAVRSLAAYLGVTEVRALGLLDDPAQLAVELRSHPLAVTRARRRLERRFPDLAAGFR
jgi:hypothetical protein